MGSLYHARRFRPLWYVGSDGNRHYELEIEDGHWEMVSNNSWEKTVSFFASHGVSSNLWPVYDDSIDVPLADVHARNAELSALVLSARLPRPLPRCADLVVDAIQSGEQVFFSRS